jgi:hypothetical protein
MQACTHWNRDKSQRSRKENKNFSFVYAPAQTEKTAWEWKLQRDTKPVRTNEKSQLETTDSGAESLTRSALEPWRQKQNGALETETEMWCGCLHRDERRPDWGLKADGQIGRFFLSF